MAIRKSCRSVGATMRLTPSSEGRHLAILDRQLNANLWIKGDF
jgi:hypothetical protein